MGLMKLFAKQSIERDYKKKKEREKKKGKFSSKEVSYLQNLDGLYSKFVVAPPIQASSSFTEIPGRLKSEEMHDAYLRIPITFSYVRFEYLSSIHIYTIVI